jgi:adenine phosphoribosyltransferase
MNWLPPERSDAPLSDWVRPVPDWPQPGVLFRDLTPLWADATAWSRTVRALATPYDASPPALVLGIEARGFLVAAALAARWSTGLLLARKPGKLPGNALREEYELEYGRASLETHGDLLKPGSRVLIADDVIATGGTAQAAYALALATGCRPIGFAFLVELLYLGGRTRLEAAAPVHSVIAYDGEGRATVAE